MPPDRGRRALFDVNVLIALLEPDHIGHGAATDAAHLDHGWASCPITENGTARIMSNSGYPNPLPAAQVIDRLGRASRTVHHEFWPDDVSVTDPKIFERQAILGPKKITDHYLLALAVKHGGRLVTFDQAIRAAAVHGASTSHIVHLRA